MLITTLFALLTGCPDPTKDKAPAVLSEPTAEAAPPAATPPAEPTAAPDGAWIPASGKIGFQGAKITAKHDGTFGEATTQVQMRGAELAAVKIEVKVGSVKTDSAKLDGHLQSPDFLDVANLPTATFESTEIRTGAPAGTSLAGATHTVVGDLTIHGVKKHIEVPAVIALVPDGWTARTEFSIVRHDFGVSYPGKADDLIADGVLIRAEISAGER